jgi:hypothetical protein
MDLSTRPLLALVGKANKGLADSNLVRVIIDTNRAHAWGILVFVPGQCMFKQDCPAESSRANNFPFQIWGIHTPKVEKTSSSLCLSSEYKIPGSLKTKKISLLNSTFGGSLLNNYSFNFENSISTKKIYSQILQKMLHFPSYKKFSFRKNIFGKV